MKKKMWHCKYCGNKQSLEITKCSNCGTDLVVYGDIILVDNKKEAEAVKPDNGGMNNGGYDGGMNNFGNNAGGYNDDTVDVGNNAGGYSGDMNNGGYDSGMYSAGNNDYGNNGGFNGGMNHVGNNSGGYNGGFNTGMNPPDGGGGNNGDSGKKGLIAIIAVLLVAVLSVAAVLGINMNKSKDNEDDYTKRTSQTTTTKPTTTKPTTTKPTTQPVAKGQIPNFAAFAGDHITNYENNIKVDGESVYFSGYEMEKALCVYVLWEYLELLMVDYDFNFTSDEMFYDDDGDLALVGQYIGTLDVEGITYTLDDGTVYRGEIILFVDNDYSATESRILMYYDDSFTVCPTGERTTVAVYDPNAAVLPDYEEFSDGRATVYYSEYDAEEDIYTFQYEVNASDYGSVLDEYVDLIEDNYSYSENNSYDDQSWIGFAYTGTEDVSGITTTFTDGSEFSGNAVTIDVDYYEDCIIVEICYVGDIELVHPIYMYEG